MKTLLCRMWHEDHGVLSFEWVLLLTLLAIGIVGGIAAARDAIISELGDVAQAVVAIDQSFFLPGDEDLGIPDVEFEDEPSVVKDCERNNADDLDGEQGGGNRLGRI